MLTQISIQRNCKIRSLSMSSISCCTRPHLFTSFARLKKSSTGMNSYARSSHHRRSLRKGVLRNFAKFTWKPLCQSLFFFKKERLWHRCFPVNFAKFLSAPFLQNISGRPLLMFQIRKPAGPSQMFFKLGVFKSFANFTRKILY